MNKGSEYNTESKKKPTKDGQYCEDVAIFRHYDDKKSRVVITQSKSVTRTTA